MVRPIVQPTPSDWPELPLSDWADTCADPPFVDAGGGKDPACPCADGQSLVAGPLVCDAAVG